MYCREDADWTFQVTLQLVPMDYSGLLASPPSRLDLVRYRTVSSRTRTGDRIAERHLISWTPMALLPATPPPTPGPTVPLPMMSTKRPMRHEVEPFPVSQTGRLFPFT